MLDHLNDKSVLNEFNSELPKNFVIKISAHDKIIIPPGTPVRIDSSFGGMIVLQLPLGKVQLRFINSAVALETADTLSKVFSFNGRGVLDLTDILSSYTQI